MAFYSQHTGAQVDEAVDKALGADAVPTPGSTNLVESGGVFAALSNRNLLDNWYFVNPVNQRGLTTYSGTGYGIDRWTVGQSSVITTPSITLSSSGVQVAGSIQQFIEQTLIPPGSKATLSALFADGTLWTNSGTIADNVNWQLVSGSIDDGDAMALRAKSQSGVACWQLVIWRPNSSSAIVAVKLELGSVSTLANDAPPNFAEELAKCQRYAFVPQIPSGSQYMAQGFNLGASASTTLNAMIVTPVTMRSTPTASGSLHSIRGNGVQINSSISIGTALAPIGNTVIVPINTSNSFAALTMGYGVLFSSLVLSADL